MAVHFRTTQAAALLKDFESRIDQSDQNDKITTWQKIVHNGTKYYTHKAAEWHQKAFFRPKVEEHQLTFNIIKNKDENITTVVYGYYHGHIVETFLNHFDSAFSEGKASSFPEPDDVVKN